MHWLHRTHLFLISSLIDWISLSLSVFHSFSFILSLCYSLFFFSFSQWMLCWWFSHKEITLTFIENDMVIVLTNWNESTLHCSSKTFWLILTHSFIHHSFIICSHSLTHTHKWIQSSHQITFHRSSIVIEWMNDIPFSLFLSVLFDSLICIDQCWWFVWFLFFVCCVDWMFWMFCLLWRRKREARMVKKRSEFAQKVHGLRAKLYSQKRHAEKIQMKKT